MMQGQRSGPSSMVSISFPLREQIFEDTPHSSQSNPSVALSDIPEDEYEEENPIDNLGILGFPSSADASFLKNLLKNKPWIFPLVYIWVAFLFWFALFAIGLFYGFLNPYWALKLEHIDSVKDIFLGCFALWSDMCAFLVLLTGYIRHRQLDYLLKASFAKIAQQIYSSDNPSPHHIRIRKKLPKMRRYNVASLYGCYLACLAYILAGNFRCSQFYLYEIFYSLYLTSMVYYVCFQYEIVEYLEKQFKAESSPYLFLIFILILVVTGGVHITLLAVPLFKNHISTFFNYLLWFQLSSSFAIYGIFFDTYLRMKRFTEWNMVTL